MIKPQHETYALILGSRSRGKVRVGRRGHLDIDQGYYAYVGGVFGSGGVGARILGHYRTSKPRRWHFDYLREFLRPGGACYMASSQPNFARILSKAGSKIGSWSVLQEVPPRLRVAKKPLTRRVESADFNRIRCPRCEWQPKPFHRWYCAPCDHPEFFDDGCGACWNTFTTHGRCPGCGHQWRWTACLNCAGWSLHADWYAKEAGRLQ
jgi:Uri superfamily endonuclease